MLASDVRLLAAALLAIGAVGCGTEGAPASGPGVAAPEPCGPGELADVDGRCQRVGVLTCPAGSIADEVGGCVATLPAEACPPGEMALPGEESCHPVLDCGAGKWDFAPPETVGHVDQAYAGGDSDGSRAKPWTPIHDAIDAAAPDTTLAITDGLYVEDVEIWSKRLMIYGRCPSRVTINGVNSLAAVQILDSLSTGTLLSGVAITGPAVGFATVAAEVRLEHVWVHDTGGRGADVIGQLATTTLQISDSLVENISGVGAFVAGANLDMNRSVIRDVVPDAAGQAGVAVYLRSGDEIIALAGPSTGAIRLSLIERTAAAAISVSGFSLSGYSLVCSLEPVFDPEPVVLPTFSSQLPNVT